MGEIINFAAVLHNRRVAAELDKRNAAQAERIANDKRAMADQLGGTIGAAIVADVTIDLREREREREALSRPTPAYCDPDNEQRGAKYEATRGMGTREIAARIRADVKAAQKSGLIPPGVKVSVRMDRFAGGSSIDVHVTALPAGFRILSDAAASWCKQFPARDWQIPLPVSEQHAPEYLALKETLQRIHSAYNRNNSDSMTDYFDVRYYGDAGYDWQVTDPLRKAEIAAARDDYWGDSAI